MDWRSVVSDPGMRLRSVALGASYQHQKRLACDDFCTSMACIRVNLLYRFWGSAYAAGVGPGFSNRVGGRGKNKIRYHAKIHAFPAVCLIRFALAFLVAKQVFCITQRLSACAHTTPVPCSNHEPLSWAETMVHPRIQPLFDDACIKGNSQHICTSMTSMCSVSAYSCHSPGFHSQHSIGSSCVIQGARWWFAILHMQSQQGATLVSHLRRVETSSRFWGRLVRTEVRGQVIRAICFDPSLELFDMIW